MRPLASQSWYGWCRVSAAGALSAGAVALLLWLAILARAAPPQSADGDVPPTKPLVGFTAPFRKATLASLQQGRVDRFVVAEGCSIAAGDVVVELDAEVQRLRTSIARLAAESTLRIELARVRLELAQRELQRLAALNGDAMVATKELDDARAEAAAADLAFELAKIEHQQAIESYALQTELLAQMSVRAPFAGYVSVHLKQLGETVEQREGVAELVQLDPLLVSLDCPLELFGSIREGDEVEVCPLTNGWPPRTGRVTLASRVADAASQTFKVKILVDNEDLSWLAGLKVGVVFEQRPAARASTPPTTQPSTIPGLDEAHHTASVNVGPPTAAPEAGAARNARGAAKAAVGPRTAQKEGS